jgi:DNA polymerase-3 subunit gamma/tau
VSYTVLAVKWRPRRFEQLVGQQHVVKALVNSLAAERLHHAYLFAGTRGVGKTTVARILAKALNCETGIVAEPCGKCSACTSIDEGRFVDLIEVDAASRTKVDDTRELLDNVQYMPTRGRFKVYLIDEVHMLSNHSFNALLKTLEEPPPHVKFLFATTDPQKLPVTVLSRCLQFNLKKLTPQLIEQQLQKICKEEGIEAESEALHAIARAADGSMRDALSLLDQGVAFGGGKIEAAQIKSMLGTIDRGHVLRLIEAIGNVDGAAVLAEVDAMDELAPDYGAVLDELLAAFQQIAIVQLVKGRLPDEDAEVFVPFAEKLTPEEVQLYYQIALHGRRDIAVCRDERMSFEMTLLRMLAFQIDAGAAAESAAGTAAGRGAPVVGAAGRGAPVVGAASGRDLARAEESRPEAAPTARQSAPTARQSAPTARQAAPAGGGGATEIGDWQALIQAAGVTGAMRNLADHCELQSATGGRLELVIAKDKTNFNTENVRGRLQKVLSEHLGREIKIAITPGDPPRATPAQRRRESESERLREAREAIERDPNIKAVQAAFDAVLEPDSIQPAQQGR